MKALHKSGLYAWSRFDEDRNIDFNSVLWCRAEGNVLVDPLELSPHDRRHLRDLGDARDIIITNSDHVRAARQLASDSRARLWVPALEMHAFGDLQVNALSDGDQPFPGLHVLELHGSKTPGELALVIDGDTLVVGDLVRGQRAGQLNLLPDLKLSDKTAAIASLRRLAALRSIDTVLVGDGWSVFQYGNRALNDLLWDVARDDA